MTKEDKVRPPPTNEPWPDGDLDFAVAELKREFPNVPATRLSAAVGSAARAVPATEGRVRLLQAARRFIRIL